MDSIHGNTASVGLCSPQRYTPVPFACDPAILVNNPYQPPESEQPQKSVKPRMFVFAALFTVLILLGISAYRMKLTAARNQAEAFRAQQDSERLRQLELEKPQ